MQTKEIVTLIATLLASGWVAAFLTQLIKRETWASWVKLALSIVLAALVALAAAWLSGDVTKFIGLWGNLTASELLTFGALVFASAQTWWRFYFKGETWARRLGAWPKA